MSGLKIILHIAIVVLVGTSIPWAAAIISRSTVRVLANVTFECQQPPVRSLSRYELTSRDLKQIMEDQGIHYVHSHMAASEADIRKDFINQVPLPNLVKDTYMRLTGVNGSEADRKLTRKQTVKNVIVYLEKEYEHEIVHPGDETQGQSTTTPPPRSRRSILDESVVKIGHTGEEATKLVESSEGKDDQQSQDGVSFRSSRSSSSSSRNGWQTAIDFCFPRGSTISGDFLRMCTICSATTTLPSTYFPQHINEAMCSGHQTDGHCFFEPSTGTPHGDCFNSTMSLNLLRRRQGTCALALVDGQTVIVDYYEQSAVQVFVGCECGMYRNSPLAEFLYHPNDNSN